MFGSPITRIRDRVVRSAVQVIKEANTPDAPLPFDIDEGTLAAAAQRNSAGREVLLHFAGAAANIYQLQPWLEPLEVLDRTHNVVLVAQSVRAASLMTQLTTLPVVCTPTARELEVFVANSDFKVCFYVSHNSRNFEALCHKDMLHVNIGHGESDKIYMASNQAKAYDYLFVAGDAAIDRYDKNLINFDTGRLLKIGRPQLDFGRACLEPTDRPTVIYAPTWEGDRPAMNYSSVTSLGAQILEQLLKPASGYRVILRPHQFTGKTDPSALVALDVMRTMIAEAATKNPEAGHNENLADDFTSLCLSADVLVADNSAVLTDFLATGRPFFVTEPESAYALLPQDGIWETGYLITRSTVNQLGAKIAAVRDNDEKRDSRSALVEYYYGDTTRGHATEQFVGKTSELIKHRDNLVASHPQRATRPAGV